MQAIKKKATPLSILLIMQFSELEVCYLFDIDVQL